MSFGYPFDPSIGATGTGATTGANTGILNQNQQGNQVTTQIGANTTDWDTFGAQNQYANNTMNFYPGQNQNQNQNQSQSGFDTVK